MHRRRQQWNWSSRRCRRKKGTDILFLVEKEQWIFDEGGEGEKRQHSECVVVVDVFAFFVGEKSMAARLQSKRCTRFRGQSGVRFVFEGVKIGLSFFFFFLLS